MKKCQLCGTNVADEARFCQNCGGSQFVVDNQQTTVPMGDTYQSTQNQNTNYQFANQQPVQQQPVQQQPVQQQPVQQQPVQQQPVQQQPVQQQPVQQQPVQQSWQPPAPQNQPKKSNVGKIIGIVAAILVTLAMIGTVAERYFKNPSDTANNDTSHFSIPDYSYVDADDSSDEVSSDDEPVKVEYTKGAFDGSVYTNEWADIKIALPEGFSNGDSSTYAAAENASTECGVYFMADDTMGMIYICFEKLPTFPIYDEKDYLDSAMKNLQKASGVEYKTPKTYSKTTIGGYEYTKAVCDFSNANGDFVNTFYVRKLDNYMIVVSAAGVDSASNDALAANITTAK